MVGYVKRKNAVQIIYYLMSADGFVSPEEEEKFALICKEVKISDSDRTECVRQCKSKLGEAIDDEDTADIITENTVKLLSIDEFDFCYEDDRVPPKLFLWDLLTVAYSDGEYSSSEKKLIKRIVRELEIDKSVYLEMDNTIKATYALNKEKVFLAHTDRPWSMIEGYMMEINKRMEVIENSVKQLIED